MRRARHVRRLGLVLGIAGLGLVGVWSYLRGSLPRSRGVIEVAGLGATARIVRDADGLPHIHAEDDADAVFALGFAHAQDRLWQMELNRRIAAGRLAEVFGAEALETDRFLRTLGLYRAAEASLDHLQPETRRILDAYAAGVNAFLTSGRRLPPEFALLGVAPEPWRPADSLGWAKMMSWDLAEDWDLELLRLRLVGLLGEARAAELLPSVPSAGPTILDAAELPRSRIDGLLALDDRLRGALGLRGLDVGSNNWVVAGRHSASGGALLANDPHLGAQIPSIWYLAELHGDRMHVVGATLPGLPGVVLGRNRDIAWGATNLNPDVQDLYVERLDPKDPSRYRFEERWEAMTVIRETIRVKGAEPVQWAARATRHGPLISDVLDDAPAPLALRWTALDPDDTTFEAFLGLNYAVDWASFRAALGRLVTPSQNFVYADAKGHIGYLGPGRIPIRSGGDGRLPMPGWDGAHEWVGFIPFEALPRAYDPPAGFIVTANNRVAGDAYPYALSNDWAPPYRAARIRERLEAGIAAGEALDLAAMRSIQGDQLSRQALELLPSLRAVAPSDPRRAAALALLQGWDGRMARDLAAPALYQAWLLHLTEVVLSDDLHGDLLEQLLRRRHPSFLAAILTEAGGRSPWCDDLLSPARETCGDAAGEALDLALDDLEARMGRDPARWRWGAIHRTQYAHNPFSRVALLKPLVHRSIENGGDPFTVNVAGIDSSAPYDQTKVPSFRALVDMGRPDADRFMITTGASGHPASPHYDDLIVRHRDLDDLPMRLSPDPPEGDRLELRPIRDAALASGP